MPWRHYMHDLDDFFIRLYKYHQKSGFTCLVCSQILELFQIIYSVLLPIFFLNYVDYDILFKNAPTKNPSSKVHIYDVVKPFNSVTIPSIQLFAIFLAFIFLVWKTIKTIHSIIINLAISKFYKDILHINDCSSLTWQDVQARIISSKHNFLAQDSHLTELDIHNRILRHSNFMIALINRGVLPIYYKVPFIGEATFFTQSFLYNCQLLFFRGPFKCIFEENWLISEDVKNASYRQVVARKLDRNIVILALINLFLFPVLFIWQILYFFYSNAALVKRDPVVLGLRNWSLYARWFCRHFNELDHQLNDRLNHAYKPAKNYMDAFTSPLLEIFARHVRFVTGSTFAVLLLLTVYDEDVIQVVHLLTIITALWLVWVSAGGLIPPDIPPRFTKVELYEQILQNIHYVPHNYPPFTPQARSAMADLYQYKLVKLLEDLLSTLATPYIMIRHLRSRSTEIVDFFRNYTIEVLGTGDVCAFAMMNIKENGNPQWQPLSLSIHRSQNEGGDVDSKRKSAQVSPRVRSHTMQDSTQDKKEHNQMDKEEMSYHEGGPLVPPNVQQFERETLLNPAMPLQTEHGKLELSLINFKLQNPSWNPNNEVQKEFIEQVTSQAIEQASSRQASHLSNHPDDDGDIRISSSGTGLFQRPRSPQRINDIDSSTAVGLSTLFLHEHARMPMSTNFPSTSGSSQQTSSKLKSDNDPLR
jgi:autophagy-related protein 9